MRAFSAYRTRHDAHARAGTCARERDPTQITKYFAELPTTSWYLTLYTSIATNAEKSCRWFLLLPRPRHRQTARRPERAYPVQNRQNPYIDFLARQLLGTTTSSFERQSSQPLAPCPNLSPPPTRSTPRRPPTAPTGRRWEAACPRRNRPPGTRRRTGAPRRSWCSGAAALLPFAHDEQQQQNKFPTMPQQQQLMRRRGTHKTKVGWKVFEFARGGEGGR